jgi:hypothetical protein
VIRYYPHIGTSQNINKIKAVPPMGDDGMNWLTQWLDRRRVKELQVKISDMKQEAEAAKEDRLTLSACTISHRIALLEQAVQKIEQKHSADGNPPAPAR